MPLTRRTLLRATVGAAGVGALSLIASEVRAAEPSKLRATHHRVPWPGLTRPLRITHLTDLHVGSAVPWSYLERVVALTWKTRPGLVVLTGDYLNHSLTYARQLRQLVGLLPKPVVATLGNHDYYSGRDGVVAALSAGGAEVLLNRRLTLTQGGVDLDIVGVDDGVTRHDDVRRALRNVARPEQALVLTHYPNTADRLAEAGAGMVLSGHTHGGQIIVPVVTRWMQKAIGNKYVAGWFQLDQTKLYVSAGLGGSVIAYRSGEQAKAEVAVFDLLPA